MVTLNTIREMIAAGFNPVEKSAVGFSGHVFMLEEKIDVQLSNGVTHTIPREFVWYYVKIPSIVSPFCPVEKHIELPFIIYEYLFRYKDRYGITKKFANRELSKWLHATTGTRGPSLRNLDNLIHYYLIIRGKKWVDKK